MTEYGLCWALVDASDIAATRMSAMHHFGREIAVG
jgi:hypothetical protein